MIGNMNQIQNDPAIAARAMFQQLLDNRPKREAVELFIIGPDTPNRNSAIRRLRCFTLSPSHGSSLKKIARAQRLARQ